jgi:hypothetical protein
MNAIFHRLTGASLIPGIAIVVTGLFVFRMLPSRGKDVVVTIKGQLISGMDNFHIFDVGLNLNYQPFTLVYTFDTTKGRRITSRPACPDTGSGIEGDGENSPGTAVLTVGDRSVTFGKQAIRHSGAWREIDSSCSQGQIVFAISESIINNGVDVRIHGVKSDVALTPNPDWTAPLSTTDIEKWATFSGFVIDAGDYRRAAKANFIFESLKIERPLEWK